MDDFQKIQKITQYLLLAGLVLLTVTVAIFGKYEYVIGICCLVGSFTIVLFSQTVAIPNAI